MLLFLFHDCYFNYFLLNYRSKVLYDRPTEKFRPSSLKEQHQVMLDIICEVFYNVHAAQLSLSMVVLTVCLIKKFTFCTLPICSTLHVLTYFVRTYFGTYFGTYFLCTCIHVLTQVYKIHGFITMKMHV